MTTNTYETMTIDQVKELLNNKTESSSFRVETQVFNMASCDTDGFYDREENIYDEFSSNIDDLYIDVAYIQRVWESYSIDKDVSLLTLHEEYLDVTVLGLSCAIDKIIDDLENQENYDYTLAMLQQENSDLYNELESHLYNDMEDSDIDDVMEFGVFITDESEGVIEETIYNYDEALAYWTVYFEPRIYDADIAIRCGLTPFTYKDTEYLALGGCGMDLSPRLQAYMMLTSNWGMPTDCRLLSDDSYFRSVVGDSITDECIGKYTLDNPKMIISFTANK